MISKSKIFAIVPIAVLLLSVFASAQLCEYELKAVFMERFTRFIDWPAESDVSDTTKPFILGIVGANPFGEILDQIYTDQKIKNRNVEIRYINDFDVISDCHIIFIARSEEDRLPEILEVTQAKAILTIGDTKGFAEKGVLINIYISKNPEPFEINQTAVEASGLYVSHLILEKARIINPVEGKQ